MKKSLSWALLRRVWKSGPPTWQFKWWSDDKVWDFWDIHDPIFSQTHLVSPHTLFSQLIYFCVISSHYPQPTWVGLKSGQFIPKSRKSLTNLRSDAERKTCLSKQKKENNEVRMVRAPVSMFLFSLNRAFPWISPNHHDSSAPQTTRRSEEVSRLLDLLGELGAEHVIFACDLNAMPVPWWTPAAERQSAAVCRSWSPDELSGWCWAIGDDYLSL